MGGGDVAFHHNEKEKKRPVALSPFIKGLAGSFGGTLEACCLQPIDVIKTRLQLDKVGKYKGIIDCGRQVVHEEGVRALWKGLTPFATHLTLKYALRMGSNSVYQSALRDHNGHLSDGGRLAAGFAAGITEALLIVTPFEVVKIRLQQQKGLAYDKLKYHNPIHCATTILREEGVRGMWSGATPTMMRNGTNQMCLFWAKNNVDKLLWGKHEGDGRQLSAAQSMISGFSAAFLGPVATGPMDVIKTRLMAQSKAGGEPQYRSMLDALVKIPRQEGIAALWRGLLPRLMRIPPGQAIVWAKAAKQKAAAAAATAQPAPAAAGGAGTPAAGAAAAAPAGGTVSLSALQALEDRKKRLAAQLKDVERQIFDLETRYLEGCNPVANALKGYESLRAVVGSAKPTKPQPINPEDRIFSGSSTSRCER
ncbi:SFC1 [Scenedesmus sp. PABB004]|nr:SFC1 [Scenedesmus sp. PABB004]